MKIMKNLKFCFYLLVSVLVLVLTSCNNKQAPVRKLETLDRTLMQKSDSFTTQDWENAIAEYEQIEQELSMYDYTDEELRMIGRMKGRLWAKISKEYINQTVDGIESHMKVFEGILEGFMEELGEDLDDLDDYDE